MAKAVIRKPKKKVCQFCKEKATGVVYKDTNVTVTAFATKHAMESYGYRFDTSDRSIVISGEGPQEGALRKFCRELKLDKRVTFSHGHTEHDRLLSGRERDLRILHIQVCQVYPAL